MVDLRAFVYLRAKDVPLQRVRKAVQHLRQLGETEHPSSYNFSRSAKTLSGRFRMTRRWI